MSLWVTFLINKIILFQYSGDFPGPQRNRNFDTWTQQTAQLDLSNEL